MNSLAMMQRVVLYQLLSTGAVALALMMLEPALAYGALGTGILTSVNLRVMSIVARRAMQNNGVAPGLMLIIGFKFVFLLGAIGVGIKVLGWHPNGVALGISTMFTGVAIAMIHGVFSPIGPTPPQSHDASIDNPHQGTNSSVGTPHN